MRNALPVRPIAVLTRLDCALELENTEIPEATSFAKRAK